LALARVSWDRAPYYTQAAGLGNPIVARTTFGISLGRNPVFRHGPPKILEVRNAKHAHDVMGKDVKISLMLPCPISVYVEKWKTAISARSQG